MTTSKQSDTPGSVSVTVRQLAQLEQDAANANDQVQKARIAIAVGEQLEPGESVDSVLMLAQDLTERVRSNARAAAGIHAAPIAGFPQVNELARLQVMSSPDAVKLLALLEEAVVLAERIDAALGNAVDEDILVQPGETRGTDLAESVNDIAIRLRGEVHGVGGSGLE